MKAHLLLFYFLLLLSKIALANLSPLQTYPPALMHQLPSGEKPGWNKSVWVDLELQHANFWNLPTRFNHLQTGKQLYYFNDFEQTLLLTEIGFALSEDKALIIELPMVARSGGGGDHFISEFHRVFGFIDFNRQSYPENQNILAVRTDGVDKIPTAASGLGNVKLKLKYWFSKNTSCSGCGWGVSGHLKIPLENGNRGLSSGGYDGSLMLHNGQNISSGFNLYFSTGVTTTLQNKVFEDWPIYKLQYMGDIATEISIGNEWELILAANLYSPYINKTHLEYTDPESDQNTAAMNKVSSGLNSLTEWRAYQLLGFKRGDFMFYVQEDWGLGSLNGSRGGLYINGAPDIALGVKWNIQF